MRREEGRGEEWMDCHNTVPFYSAIIKVACPTCSGREDGTKKSEQEKTEGEYLNAWNRLPIKYIKIIYTWVEAK